MQSPNNPSTPSLVPSAGLRPPSTARLEAFGTRTKPGQLLKLIAKFAEDIDRLRQEGVDSEVEEHVDGYHDVQEHWTSVVDGRFARIVGRNDIMDDIVFPILRSRKVEAGHFLSHFYTPIQGDEPGLVSSRHVDGLAGDGLEENRSGGRLQDSSSVHVEQLRSKVSCLRSSAAWRGIWIETNLIPRRAHLSKETVRESIITFTIKHIHP